MILQFRPRPRNRKSKQAKHTGTQVPGPLQNKTSGRTRNTSTTQLIIALTVENIVENQDCPTSRLLGISCDRKIHDRFNSALERSWLIISVLARTKWSGLYFLGSKCDQIQQLWCVSTCVFERSVDVFVFEIDFDYTCLIPTQPSQQLVIWTLSSSSLTNHQVKSTTNEAISQWPTRSISQHACRSQFRFKKKSFQNFFSGWGVTCSQRFWNRRQEEVWLECHYFLRGYT